MNYWKHHDNKMKGLKQVYNRISNQKQNRLQEIFDTFNFNFDTFYNIADIKTKNRINGYIEEWKDKDLLKGYFGTLAKNIYKRSRVKNSEILELLIYGAYVEEQDKLKERELNVLYQNANYYYQEGQKEVNNTLKSKKAISVMGMALFLALMDIPTYNGSTWEQYLELSIYYNMFQLYRQATINLQQQRLLDIKAIEFQRIINQQNNQRLNINGDKISGAVDVQSVGLNNLAKIEGIKEQASNNAQVKFMATIDGKETDMCHSLDGQIFYINKENEFNRYYGETQKDLVMSKIRCKGLVLGLNLPPISHHYHFCRSTITYQVPIEKTNKKEYNLDIPKINKKVKQLLKDTEINKKIQKLFKRYLTNKNIIIDYEDNKPMYYSVDKDKIVLNPKHKDFKYYNLQDSLTHEIIHMIDTRNSLLINNKNIYSNIRSAQIEINSEIDKYQEIFNQEEYFYDLCAGDTIGLLTGNKIKAFYGHPVGYTYIEDDIVANIETAYLTNNKLALDLFNSSDSLRKLKDKVVKMYDKYTR